MDFRAHLRRRLGQGEMELPVLPRVAHEAMRMLSDDGYDVRTLAELIDRDQAITGHVLRVANSAIVRPAARVASVRQAICLVGMREVGRIALLVSTQTRLFRAQGFEQDLAILFRHAFTTALFGREIARMAKLNAEEAFVASLLHDLGRAVLLQEIADYLKTHDDFIERGEITALLSELHAEVGAVLCDAWKLPARIGETIRFHHQPAHAPFHAAFAHLVQLADAFAHHLDDGPSPKPISEHPALAALNLYPADVDRLEHKRASIRDIVNAMR